MVTAQTDPLQRQLLRLRKTIANGAGLAQVPVDPKECASEFYARARLASRHPDSGDAPLASGVTRGAGGEARSTPDSASGGHHDQQPSKSVRHLHLKERKSSVDEHRRLAKVIGIAAIVVAALVMVLLVYWLGLAPFKQ
jgi:hypothetical protein